MRAMKLLRRFGYLALLLAATPIMGGADDCGGGGEPPAPQPDTRLQCSCSCVDACTVYEIDLNSGLWTGRCVVAGPTQPYAQTGTRCVSAGASGTDRDAACQTGCSALNPKSGLVQGFLSNPRTCNAVKPAGSPAGATVSSESPNACDVPTGQISSPLTAVNSSPDALDVPVQPAQSSASLRIGADVATFRPEGAIHVSGGNCPNASCPISIGLLRLVAPPVLAVGPRTFANTVVDNETVFLGTKNADGSLSLQLNTVSFVTATTLNGTRTTIQFFPESGQPTGFYDAATGRFSLSGTFVRTGSTSSTDQTLTITIQGFADQRPPVADAGPDITLRCSAGTVRLDGSRSSDPNNDITRFAWTEGSRELASGATPTIPVPAAGVHDILLTVFDSTGRHDDDTVRITVQDDQAPRFTTVPASVTVTDCRATPNLGQAVATDDCGSAVTITNNAPATFPPGVTVVTYTARDAAGNTATVTQTVTVPLADDPACCPAGSNIVVLTPNNDTFTGTAGSDCILGRGGQDRLNGGGGNDYISGGDGDDIIGGDAGDDRLFGGAGQDQLNGGDGNDQLSGGEGDDTCNGGPGNDVITGGGGQDHLNGNDGNDTLVGNDGDDTLDGGAGDDSLDGSGLHDLCIGGTGNNTFLICERRQ